MSALFLLRQPYSAKLVTAAFLKNSFSRCETKQSSICIPVLSRLQSHSLLAPTLPSNNNTLRLLTTDSTPPTEQTGSTSLPPPTPPSSGVNPTALSTAKLAQTSPTTNISPSIPAATLPSSIRSAAKPELVRPKKSLSIFAMLLSEKLAELRKQNPGKKNKELFALASEVYKKLNDAQLQEYRDRAALERAHAKKEIADYKAKLDKKPKLRTQVLIENREHRKNLWLRRLHALENKLGKPKGPITAYFAFQAERIKAAGIKAFGGPKNTPARKEFTEFLKKTAVEWKALPLSQKNEYSKQFQEAKTKTDAELSSWSQRCFTSQDPAIRKLWEQRELALDWVKRLRRLTRKARAELLPQKRAPKAASVHARKRRVLLRGARRRPAKRLAPKRRTPAAKRTAKPKRKAATAKSVTKSKPAKKAPAKALSAGGKTSVAKSQSATALTKTRQAAGVKQTKVSPVSSQAAFDKKKAATDTTKPLKPKATSKDIGKDQNERPDEID